MTVLAERAGDGAAASRHMSYFSLLLALFLILLCFFIALVALSRLQFEPAAVARSALVGDGASEWTSRSAASELIADLRAQVVRWGDELLVQDLGDGPVLTLRAGRSALIGEDGRLTFRGGEMLGRMAEQLLREADGLALQVEIVLAPAAGRAAAARAAGSLARELVRRGAPPGRIAVALDPIAAEAVHFRFQIRPVAGAGGTGGAS